MRIIHTADWQIGKPFAGVDDPHKRALLRQERISAIDRLGETARKSGAELVIVSGDLFDSPTPDKSTVSAACAAIGRIGLPVYAIPGNHDHGGPGSIWEQDFFLREGMELAKNFHILTSSEPLELEGAVLFPCPLMRRQDAADPTVWLRSADFSAFGSKPRIVIAHGSTQDFTTQDPGDEDGAERGANRIDIDRLPLGELDYIALGDWHGMKEVTSKAWYPGTPELDRFPKGGDHAPGYVLAVTVGRGAVPAVEPVATARFGWHWVDHNFTDDAALVQLEEKMGALLGSRAGEDLVRMALDGSLSIAHFTQLESLLEKWRSRLLRLKIENRVRVAPSPEEINALTLRASDPLISRVAAKLIEQMSQGGDEGETARVALRELHAKIS